jgi:hypothetical protein
VKIDNCGGGDGEGYARGLITHGCETAVLQEIEKKMIVDIFVLPAILIVLLLSVGWPGTDSDHGTRLTDWLRPWH